MIYVCTARDMEDRSQCFCSGQTPITSSQETKTKTSNDVITEEAHNTTVLEHVVTLIKANGKLVITCYYLLPYLVVTCHISLLYPHGYEIL